MSATNVQKTKIKQYSVNLMEEIPRKINHQLLIMHKSRNVLRKYNKYCYLICLLQKLCTNLRITKNKFYRKLNTNLEISILNLQIYVSYRKNLYSCVNISLLKKKEVSQ